MVLDDHNYTRLWRLLQTFRHYHRSGLKKARKHREYLFPFKNVKWANSFGSATCSYQHYNFIRKIMPQTRRLLINVIIN